MKQLKNSILFISSCSLLSFLVGCAGVQFVEDRTVVKRVERVEDYSYSVHIPYLRYVATPIDMDQLCRQKAWKDVYVTGDVLGGVVSFVTLGILSPQRTKASCAN